MWTVAFLVAIVATTVQANVGGSCEGRCGAPFDAIQPCQCNSHCITHGDCCSDYQTLCVLGTCSGRCHSSPDNSKPCQCNSVCNIYDDCCNDFQELCEGSNTESLSDVMNQIWNLDSNRVSLTDYTVNYQGQVSSGNTGDSAGSNFFSYLNTNVLSRSTFSLMVDLLDNYNPNIGQSESLTPGQWDEVERFLDAILATDIMDKAFHYLQNEGKVTGSADFRDVLKELWFNLYPRSSSGPVDSSGFEHVIVGERNSGVSGFHNWVQFYLEEKAGRIDYRGYVKKTDPEIVGAQFLWNGYRKSMGTFFVAASPEFDLAVYSICALMHPNSVCSFTMNGWSMRIQTWDVNHKSGLQIASAYPIL